MKLSKQTMEMLCISMTSPIPVYNPLILFIIACVPKTYKMPRVLPSIPSLHGDSAGIVL